MTLVDNLLVMPGVTSTALVNFIKGRSIIEPHETA